jgi:hypothetical protein
MVGRVGSDGFESKVHPRPARCRRQAAKDLKTGLSIVSAGRRWIHGHVNREGVSPATDQLAKVTNEKGFINPYLAA